MTRKEILKVRERALSCIGTYTPTEAKLRIDAYALRDICDRALRAKPLRYKLKRKEVLTAYENPTKSKEIG